MMTTGLARRVGPGWVALLLLAGCTSLYMPQIKPYQSFMENLSPPQDVEHLPPYSGKEVWLGYHVTPDGLQENRLGSGGRCVFVFTVDLHTRRMVSWRFASKNDASECQPSR